MMNIEKEKSRIVTFKTINQIGVITIDNGTQNKIDRADFLELDVLKEWVTKYDLKGLVIMGKGRHFSAGADVDSIKESGDNTDYLRESLRKGREILSFIESLPIITVAAISGVCFGAGLEIALSCQFIVATNNAILAFPESNIGIMPGLTGTIRLTRRVGKNKALELIISGKTISADEAYEMGLVDRRAPNKGHLSAAIELINELTHEKSTRQINNIIQSINNSTTESEEIAMEYECELFLDLVKNFYGGKEA